MAYTPLSTVATGDLWTAANHNTYIKDNFAAGVPDIFTAAGDIVYAIGADVAARLPIGPAGTHLEVISSLPAWSNIGHPVTVRKTADETVTNSTTFQNDDVLKQTINANESWVVHWVLFYTGNGAGGIKVAVTVPASPTSFRACAHGVNAAGTPQFGDTGTSGATIITATTMKSPLFVYATIQNGANAGDVQLQWAQETSSGTGTVVLIGSYMVAIRLS